MLGRVKLGRVGLVVVIILLLLYGVQLWLVPLMVAFHWPWVVLLFLVVAAAAWWCRIVWERRKDRDRARSRRPPSEAYDRSIRCPQCGYLVSHFVNRERSEGEMLICPECGNRKW